MRYLIFGDVHGNLPALEKILEVERHGYDQIICHGDTVNYGPWSNECVDLIDGLNNAICLLGNHEKSYLQGRYEGTNKVAKSFFDFCYPKFARFETIKRYQEKFELKDFEVIHTINDNYIFPDTDWEEIKLNKNCIIGHSHYQFDRFNNIFRLINTGSVGQNRKKINVAQYLLFDDKLGMISLKSILYDFNLILKQMKNDNYPDICLNYYISKFRKQ